MLHAGQFQLDGVLASDRRGWNRDRRSRPDLARAPVPPMGSALPGEKIPACKDRDRESKNHRGCTETGSHSRVTELLALPGRLIQPKGFPEPVARGRRAGVISNLVTSGLPAILRGSSG